MVTTVDYTIYSDSKGVIPIDVAALRVRYSHWKILKVCKWLVHTMRALSLRIEDSL